MNIFGNLLDLVDYIYSPEAKERNFASIINVKIERIHGLDRLSCECLGQLPSVSVMGDNFQYFQTSNRSIVATLEWLKAKQSELNSFAETGRSMFIKNCFLGMYVKEFATPLRYNHELDCYEIAFYTYTEGTVIKRKTREKVTIMIEPCEESLTEIIEPEIKEEEVKETFNNNELILDDWLEFENGL